MKIRDWCKCKKPIICGYGPLVCIVCDKVVFKAAKDLPNRKEPIEDKLNRILCLKNS